MFEPCETLTRKPLTVQVLSICRR